jgi:xylan 1,4-beta-xylosidase
MFVYREDGGQAAYNFQYIDELFDRLLEIGIRPFVEFGFCPADLATEKATVFWWKGNGSPPNDYAKWSELVRRTVVHWIGRYGIEEVRKWYFEVWNEPNLRPFFRGARSQYFELYRATVTVLKELDFQLRVGGPSTSNFVPDARFDGEEEDVACHVTVREAKDLDALEWRPVWVAAFLEFCHRNGLPVDFVSAHPYPTDWPLDELGGTIRLTRGVGATPTDLECLRKIVDASAYPNAEIHLTEWNSSSSPRDFSHDFIQAATYVVKMNLEVAHLADSLSYWTFTDIFEEGGAGDTIFHGGFGMINLQGIVKPVYHAYRMLYALGDELLEKRSSGVLTRDSASGKITGLFYHYPPEMPLSIPASFDTREVAERTLGLGRPEQLDVNVTGLDPNAAVLVETLDVMHGNAMQAWRGMGSPERPTREQTAVLRTMAENTRKETILADKNGEIHLRRGIEPWSLVLMTEI